jgi:GMP synthase (glutamine-hydrolysing)
LGHPIKSTTPLACKPSPPPQDEVRQLGVVLGVSPASVWRHPFPGPGLAIRVLGPVDEGRLGMARAADAVLIEELRWGALRLSDVTIIIIIIIIKRAWN